ncbi:hypothetical protein [Escherichia phage pEC-M2929-1AR.1]|nr:hypothetical protein [Escherichia phage pEC-M2929-1AR.1]
MVIFFLTRKISLCSHSAPWKVAHYDHQGHYSLCLLLDSLYYSQCSKH